MRFFVPAEIAEAENSAHISVRKDLVRKKTAAAADIYIPQLH